MILSFHSRPVDGHFKGGGLSLPCWCIALLIRLEVIQWFLFALIEYHTLIKGGFTLWLLLLPCNFIYLNAGQLKVWSRTWIWWPGNFTAGRLCSKAVDYPFLAGALHCLFDCCWYSDTNDTNMIQWFPFALIEYQLMISKAVSHLQLLWFTFILLCHCNSYQHLRVILIGTTERCS